MWPTLGGASILEHTFAPTSKVSPRNHAIPELVAKALQAVSWARHAGSLSTLLFGIKDRPASDAKALAAAKDIAQRPGPVAMTAAFFAGSAHHYGIGAKQDFAEARKWYELAIARGDHVAGLENFRIEERLRTRK